MMNVRALGLLINGVAFSLAAQTPSVDSSSTALPQANLWFSAGVGPGTNGIALVGSGWFNYEAVAIGVHSAESAPLWGNQRTSETALLIGTADLVSHGAALVAAGPSRLTGRRSSPGRALTQQDKSPEYGAAVAVEGALTAWIIGVGVDVFAARSAHRKVAGVTLSLQLGWLGK